jgi:hypothetical protein
MQLCQVGRLALLAAALACSDPVSVTQDKFTIHATGREVVLSNAAAQPTFYLIVERETAAGINFATCVDGSQCLRVAAGSTVRVPYRDITGYRPGSQEAIV